MLGRMYGDTMKPNREYSLKNDEKWMRCCYSTDFCPYLCTVDKKHRHENIITITRLNVLPSPYNNQKVNECTSLPLEVGVIINN